MSAQPDLSPEAPPAAEPSAPVASPRTIAPAASASALRAARLRRRLSEEQVAERAGLYPEEVRWLEEARVYRFRSPEDAVLAAILYGTAVGIDRREARALAGFAPARQRLDRRARLTAAALALIAIVVAAVLSTALGGSGRAPSAAPAREAPGPALPPARAIVVDVLNGNGDINWTHQVATRIAAIGYRVRHVMKASRFDYRRTAVYYEPSGAAVAARLAAQLGVLTQPLPGGSDPRRLVVIVGPQRGPG